MKFIPGQDRVLVKLIEQKENKESSIIIPDTVQQDPKVRLCEIIALGPRKFMYRVPEADELLELEVGDRVYIGQYGGIELPSDDNVKLLVITYDDILVKIKEV